MMNDDIHIFIPSYHRADNIKTAHYFVKKGWRKDRIHVVIDDQGGDEAEYRAVCERMGVRLHVFNIDEQRPRYDFVHRQSPSRRAAGEAIKEARKQSVRDKREVVHRFAEIILMNDEGNTMPAHQIAGKAVELYNKIEDYL